jgi:putative endonuclease
MTTSAHALGKAGEDAGLKYLQAQGYEIDLVVRLGHELLVFVEVKTRSSVQYGHPEEFVTPRKQELFRHAAEQVQEDLNWTGDIRFDILSLTPAGGGLRVEHFQDAFY